MMTLLRARSRGKRRRVGLGTDAGAERAAPAAGTQSDDRTRRYAHLAAIISTSADAIISADAAGRIRSWNAAAESLFGYAADEIIGQPTSILIPAHLAHIHKGAVDLLRAGRSRRRETVRQRKDGACVDVAMTATPIFDAVGSYLGYSLILRDIGERKAAERALAEAEAFSRSVLEASRDAILVLAPDGRLEFLNEACCQLLAIASPTGRVGRLWQEVLPAAAHADFDRALEEARQKSIARYTASYGVKRRAARWYDVLISPVTGSDGSLIRYVVLARDTTEAKAQQEHIALIMRELCHRAKNLLAVISAMARNTAAQSASVADFERAFSARIRSLSFSHDLLVQRDWTGAGIHQLVKVQLAPFASAAGGRLEFAGPCVILKPEAGQMLGLALHELATNASKYGAFSTTAGCICVTWTIAADADGRQALHLHWQERGGPTVQPATRTGFGRMVIEEMVAETLGGTAELVMAPEGIEWRASIPEIYWTPSTMPQPAAA